MNRTALVIGIDTYKSAGDLKGCVADAIKIAALFEYHENKERNMDVVLRTSNNTQLVQKRSLLIDIAKLFSNSSLELAVLYFAGHGYTEPVTGETYLVTTDGGADAMDWGIPLSTILRMANTSTARSSLIILDCCHSGSMGKISAIDSTNDISILAHGVSIITASKENELAIEYGTHGLFTALLIDGLEGAAADVTGVVKPAALYTLIDQALTTHEQRPLYKAVVDSQIELRRITPIINLVVLRKLASEYFPSDATAYYSLGPEDEPDRGDFEEQYKHIKVDGKRVKAYRDLQACAKLGLVVPDGYPHMWDAAMHKTGCILTALGRYYWKLGKRNRI